MEAGPTMTADRERRYDEDGRLVYVGPARRHGAKIDHVRNNRELTKLAKEGLDDGSWIHDETDRHTPDVAS